MQTGIPFPNLSPEIFSVALFGFQFALRWYALAYIVGIIIGWRIAVAALKRPVLWRNDTPAMTPEQLENLLTWIIVGIIGGGRLGYVLFYKPAFYLANPLQIPILWEGGMSFHGGLIGVILAIVLFSRRHVLHVGSVADSIALASPPAILLGRIANFINAELWGRPTDLPWGVIFPGEAAQACATATTLCARHPSQLYEATLEGAVLLALLCLMAFRWGGLKRPWLLTGTFVAGYGFARFLVEFVRQPDTQFQSPGNPLGLAVHMNGYGLTMGQLLTVPMILFGIAIVAHARKDR